MNDRGSKGRKARTAAVIACGGKDLGWCDGDGGRASPNLPPNPHGLIRGNVGCPRYPPEPAGRYQRLVVVPRRTGSASDLIDCKDFRDLNFCHGLGIGQGQKACHSRRTEYCAILPIALHVPSLADGRAVLESEPWTSKGKWS